MKKISFVITVCVSICVLQACSKKTTPSASEKEKPTVSVAKPIKTATPTVITVNDASAKKSFDGRLYYDLEGHRYWKNYKDGKYYKYNKNMQGNPDFKTP